MGEVIRRAIPLSGGLLSFRQEIRNAKYETNPNDGKRKSKAPTSDKALIA
jgi:hypothetical protein